MSSPRSGPLKTVLPLMLSSPLAEAMFELRWELQKDKKTSRLVDPAYPMMYGRLYERLKEEFSFVEDLPAVQVHPEASPYIVRHRIRKEKNGHPLFQIGPGVMTVNEAKGYSWSAMQQRILQLIEWIFDLYPTEHFPLQFTHTELRYLNGIRFDPRQEDPVLFLAEKLNIKIDVAPDLFTLNEIGTVPRALGLNLAYPLHKPKGTLSLGIHLGELDERPAYILQTLVQSGGEWVPSDRQGFDSWLDSAHEVAVNSFFSFCKGTLMEKFCE